MVVERIRSLDRFRFVPIPLDDVATDEASSRALARASQRRMNTRDERRDRTWKGRALRNEVSSVPLKSDGRVNGADACPFPRYIMEIGESGVREEALKGSKTIDTRVNGDKGMLFCRNFPGYPSKGSLNRALTIGFWGWIDEGCYFSISLSKAMYAD